MKKINFSLLAIKIRDSVAIATVYPSQINFLKKYSADLFSLESTVFDAIYGPFRPICQSISRWSSNIIVGCPFSFLVRPPPTKIHFVVRPFIRLLRSYERDQ